MADETRIPFNVSDRTFVIGSESASVQGNNNRVTRDLLEADAGTDLLINGSGNAVFIETSPDITAGKKNYVMVNGSANKIDFTGDSADGVVFSRGDFNTALLHGGDDRTTLMPQAANAPSFHSIDGGAGRDQVEIFAAGSVLSGLMLVKEGDGAFRIDGMDGSTLANLAHVEELRLADRTSETATTVDLTSLAPDMSAGVALPDLPTMPRTGRDGPGR